MQLEGYFSYCFIFLVDSFENLDIQPPVTPTDPYSSDDSNADKDFIPFSEPDSDSANDSDSIDNDNQGMYYYYYCSPQ